ESSFLLRSLPMSLTRRYFLKMAAAAGAAATLETVPSRAQAQSSSPNEKLGIAVIGVGGRGSDHLSNFAGRKDAEVLYVCDVDEKTGQGLIKGVEERQGRAPKFE